MPATRQSVRRTLRAAPNAAIAQQLLTFNPAAHLEAGAADISQGDRRRQLEAYQSAPKTDGRAGTISLDSGTAEALRAHRERLRFGSAWQDTGKVSTREDGSWLHPETTSGRPGASWRPPACRRSAFVIYGT